MSATSVGFTSFFRAATGHEPYAYQRILGESPSPPAVLNVPTGAGKTQALLASWLYARRVLGTGPRRLVYALPMRTLVEQTASVAHQMRKLLKIDPDDLRICTLMGGTDQAELRDWQLWPDRDQILIGTIDMLLSRALNRGYATTRFRWPVPFGLLNNDCRWVFDEVQLMGPARATSAQLAGLRNSLGTVLPCETVWVSATVDKRALETIDHPDLGSEISLPDEDRVGALRRRLEARKELQRVDLADNSASSLPAVIARIATEHHINGTRTLVVLNTVDLAQATYRELKQLKMEGIVLLHSRFRPAERSEHMQDARSQPGEHGTIVVATQVVEAGVDMSARTLITETAPFSSIVQRLGRCNREGEYEQATIVWLDRGPIQAGAASEKASAPYSPADIEHARAALLERVGTSMSPAALAQMEVNETPDDPTVLRRQDLLDLFDTSPDLSGLEIDIAPFIRDDEDRSIAVLFRAISDAGDAADQPAAERDELVQVPRGSLGKRECWTVDYVHGKWARRSSTEIPPGATVMLRARDGGYDPEIGWDGKAKGPVEPVAIKENVSPEGIGNDPGAQSKHREELSAHLQDVTSEAEALADALGVTTWRAVLRCAGALHDIGKAHPVFQQAVRALIGDAADVDEAPIWAKSGTRGRIAYDRPYFRHELVSALAARKLDGKLVDVMPGAGSRELIAYLVAAHHGRVRLSIRPAPGEKRPRNAPSKVKFALGVVDGDVLPSLQTPIGDTPAITIDLSAMVLGAEDSWTETAVGLRDDPDLGPFRLGFLEALLRIADWRASSG